MAINLYSPHVDKLEANQVYVIRKVKKITMKTDLLNLDLKKNVM